MLRLEVRLVALGVLFAGLLAAQQTTKAQPKPQSAIAPGIFVDGLYRNPAFGFSYKIPFGWVDRTSEMQQDSADPSKAQVLLAVFAHPPEATTSTINSAVVIAAESISSYPGLKTAADYFVPLTEITTAKGFKVVQEPYEFSHGGKQLVRGDFSKPQGSLTVYQTSLVALQKGYVLSFTFLGGSEDEIEENLAGLNFAASGRPGGKPAPAPNK